MKKNMSVVDRILRVVVGLALLGFGIFGGITGAWLVVMIALGALLLVTGVVGFCPAYALFKFSTLKS